MPESRHKTNLSTKSHRKWQRLHNVVCFCKVPSNQSQRLPDKENIYTLLRIHSNFRWYYYPSMHAVKILPQIFKLLKQNFPIILTEVKTIVWFAFPTTPLRLELIAKSLLP